MLETQVRFGLGHATWALSRLLDECGRLNDEQLRRDFGIGPGSLTENIGHTIECMFFFADCFAGRTYGKRTGFDEECGTVTGLKGLLAAADRELSEAVPRALRDGAPEAVSWESSDTGVLSVAAAVAQVFDHAAAHRAQCVHMLKRLGVTPLPDLDPMSYEFSRAGR